MKIILIHGLAATKKSNWFPWLENVNIGERLPLFIGQSFPLFIVFGTFIPRSQRLPFSNDLSCGMSRP